MDRIEELKNIMNTDDRITPDQYLSIGTELLELSEKANDNLGIIMGYTALCVSVYYSLDYKKLLEYANKMLELALKEKNYYYIAKAYQFIGTYYSTNKQNALTVKYYFNSVLAFEKINDYEGLCDTYFNITNIFISTKEREKAYLYYKYAYEYYEKAVAGKKNSEVYYESKRISLLVNYSFILALDNKLDELKKNLDYFETIKDTEYYKSDEIYIYILYGRYYVITENKEEFIKWMNLILNTVNDTTSDNDIFNDLCYFFDYALIINEYDLAKRINVRMTSFAELEDYPSLLVSSYKRHITLCKMQNDESELILLKRKYFEALKRESTYMDAETHEFVGTSLRTMKLLRNNEKNRQSIEEFESKSTYDALTGVGSRYGLENKERLTFLNAVEEQKYYSVIIIDIDKFKDFNDNFGHLEGDICLQRVAEAIKNSSGDFYCGRFGGDEFMLIAKGKSPEYTRSVCEAIRKEISRVCVEENSVAPITLSIGYYSAVPKEGETHFDYSDRADEYLYKVKENGRNNVCGNS